MGPVSGQQNPEMTAAAQIETQRDPRESWPSVTRILKAAGLSPWLDVDLDMLRRATEYRLSERVLRYILTGVYPEMLDAKRELGSMVHLAIRDIEHGIQDPWWEDEPWTAYVDAYLQFKEETHYTASLTEHRVYNDSYQYRGDLDSLGMLDGKVEALIDIKTVLDMDRAIGYQLAGYDGCLPANPKRVRLGLQLKKDGSYQIHPYNDRNDLKVFLAALVVANAKGIQP